MPMWESQLLNRQDLDDEAWNAFVDASPMQYLYYYTWWLDVVSPGWKAIAVYQKGRPVMLWPLPMKTLGPLQACLQPQLTQFGGPLFAPFPQSNHRRHTFQKKALLLAIQALPRMLFPFDINLHPALQYFLPFTWKKFTLKPRFTYWLPLEKSSWDVEGSFSTDVRRHRKRALKEGFQVMPDDNPKTFTAIARRAKVMNSKQATLFEALWHAAQHRHSGLLLTARGTDGALASAIGVFSDGQRFILIGSATEPALRHSSANTLLVTDAIFRAAAEPGIHTFDFEGSMLPGVEQFFRSFNPQGKMYLNVKKLSFPR